MKVLLDRHIDPTWMLYAVTIAWLVFSGLWPVGRRYLVPSFHNAPAPAFFR